MPYQVRNWSEHFEINRSRELTVKTWGKFPIKHGLGFMRLVSQNDGNPDRGAAMYGAFVAMICILHRQHKDVRDGWVTEDGTHTGADLGPDSLEYLTRIRAEIFGAMLDAVSHPSIGWVEWIDAEDVERKAKATAPVEILKSKGSQNSKFPMTVTQLQTVIAANKQEAEQIYRRCKFDRRDADAKWPVEYARWKELRYKIETFEEQLRSYE